MSAALLLEEQQAAVVGEGQAVNGVVYRPEAVDLSGWPSEGPWSRVRRDPETGVGVPLLRIPELDRRTYHRLAALGAARGELNRGELHLAQWIQDDIGPGGAIAWSHEDMTDYADHYGHYTSPAKPKKCSANTFWRRLSVLRHDVGLVWHLESASKGCPARYEACVRADSPLLQNVPEDLARALHLDVLARLLGEHEVPASTEPVRGAPLTEIAELYGGAQLAPEQHADAAAVSRMGQYEIAMMHARSAEEEALIASHALASSRGWADPEARPAPPPVSETPDGHVPAFQKPREIALPGRPLPAALRADLARLAGIKRTVVRSVDLTAATGPVRKCKALPITARVSLSPLGFGYGLSDAHVAGSQDGRSKTKKAPTARNINLGAGFGLAADGWPVVQGGPVEDAGPVLAPKRPGFDLGEGERVARRVWAIWRRERPRETLLGAWVTGPDGVSVWEPGGGWHDLAALIARCLRRVPESAILNHARGVIGPSVRNPVATLAWRLRTKVMPLAPYARRRDVSKPAAYVLEEERLSPAEQKARQDARHAAGWSGVRSADSIAAEDLRAALAKAEVDGAVYWARDAEERATPEQSQAAAEHLRAREAAVREDELWRQRKAAAAGLDRKLAEAGALDPALFGLAPAGSVQPTPHAEVAIEQVPEPAPAVDEGPKSRVAERLARWATEGRVRGVQD